MRMTIISALLLGNNDDAPYHPLLAVQEHLIGILGASFSRLQVPASQVIRLTPQAFALKLACKIFDCCFFRYSARLGRP
ncbi:hypothetical protein AB6A23_05210 [Paenibacillus tarimensis]